MTPTRIQRKRTKGYRLPPNTVCVSRGTKWGNPFRPDFPLDPDGPAILRAYETVVAKYRALLAEHPGAAQWISVLRGRNLACWCPLDRPCHADVLLEIANRQE